jgi:hypothetical protein
MGALTISTEDRPSGAVRDPNDTRDGESEHGDPANAGARVGGEAAGGIRPQPGDPTNPAAADARAADRDRRQEARGLGDDGPRSTDGTR